MHPVSKKRGPTTTSVHWGIHGDTVGTQQTHDDRYAGQVPELGLLQSEPGQRRVSSRGGAQRTYKPYRLHYTNKWPVDWPIHVKSVPHLDIDKIKQDMNSPEHSRLCSFLYFFTAEYLEKVQISGESLIELSPKQVEFLISTGLFKVVENDAPIGAKLHIFLIAEPKRNGLDLLSTQWM
jgi:hypothetical protein